MSIKFSQLSNISTSATVAINTLANKKRQAGKRVYNLSAGEPMIVTPEVIIEAGEKAMRDGQTKYPPSTGIAPLRLAASEWMNKNYYTHYDIDHTLVTCGGKFGLYLLLQALVESDTEVLIPAPYWVSYPSMVQLFGGTPITVNTSESDGWKIEVADLEKLFTPKTKILIFNNGSNPTGVLYSREELEKILTWCSEKNIIAISDEVYSGLVYDGGKYISCASFGNLSNNVIVVHSCSKNFAMTGWRVGFVFAPAEIIRVLATLQSQSITNTSSISQWAALSALQNAETIIPQIRTEMQKRRDTLVEVRQKLFGGNLPSPASALYAFWPINSFGVNDTDSVRFCEKVLKEGNVAMVPGAPFGKEGYVRISFGETKKELTEAMEALRRYL